MRRLLYLFAAVALFSTQAFASGFAVKDQGTKAMGMANAFTAVADDASAAWYNPAALSFQDGVSLTVGGQYVIPSVKYAGASGAGKMDKKNHLIPFGYISYNSDALPVTLGLAVNAPFGLSTDWTNSTSTFAVTGLGSVTFSELNLVNVNPVASFKINDRLSVAGGASYVKARRVAFNTTGLVQSGNGSGWGGNAALFYKGDEFNVGLTYRSRTKIKVKGRTTLIAASSTSNTDVSVTLPDMLSAGVAFHPSDNWLVSFQYDWVNWKTFDQLKFNYTPAFPGVGASITVPENYKATSSFGVGAQWSYNEKMRARFGYSYDQTPLNDVDFSSRIVDNDRHFFTLGYGYSVSEKTTIDLAYGYIMVSDRTQTASSNTAYNGTYKANLHIVSAAMSHRF